MNTSLANVLVDAIWNAPTQPQPHDVQVYLIEPLSAIPSRVGMHYRIVEMLNEYAQQADLPALISLFNLTWWDLSDAEAQTLFDWVKALEVHPDDNLSLWGREHITRRMCDKFPTLT